MSKEQRPRTQMSGWTCTHPSPLSQQTSPMSVGAAKARADTSSAFQKSAQLRADEGQFPLFKNKARSDTTAL